MSALLSILGPTLLIYLSTEDVPAGCKSAAIEETSAEKTTEEATAGPIYGVWSERAIFFVEHVSLARVSISSISFS